ncbi:MAG: biotin--[acetyl-CoA-carboxylase] ligase, partial [SAR324 cluster bacterium]
MKRIKWKTERCLVGKELILFESIDSTNTWLLNQDELLPEKGLVICSKRQTAGRGTHQRKWDGGNQDHLYCSLLIHPQLDPKYLPATTLLVGLGVYKAMAAFGLKDLSIKWPNDLLIAGKKVCGILCEVKFLSSKYDLDLITTAPTVIFELLLKNGETI